MRRLEILPNQASIDILLIGLDNRIPRERIVSRVVEGQWTTSVTPTKTQRDAYATAAELFTPLLTGAPWTPGRIPNWQ